MKVNHRPLCRVSSCTRLLCEVLLLLSSVVLATSSDPLLPTTGDSGQRPLLCRDGLDISEIKNTLRYNGPQQRIHREGKLNFRCFNAQHWEDLFMFQHFFGNVTGGFFIELGALDGYSYSVSYFFEQFLNWRGLMIEASPRNHHQFKTKMRKLPLKRRRRSEYMLSAVCNDPKPLTYVSKEGTGAGILEFMPEDQQIRNKKMCTESTQLGAGAASLAAIEREAAAGNSNDCTLTTIQCIHLGDLLKQRGVQKVDMFVLDVEGAELEVLSTLRLDEIPVHFFLIELDGKAPEKDSRVRCILREHNYEPVGRLDLNEVWRKADFDVSKYAGSYGAPVPISQWSGCFRTPVDETFFARSHQVQPQGNGDASLAKGGELDRDFNEFEIGGVDEKGAKDTSARDSKHFVYGQQPRGESETFNDLVSGVMWLLLVGVPLSMCVIIRRRKRRSNSAAVRPSIVVST